MKQDILNIIMKEYVENGKISSKCPLCKNGVLTTKGFVSGSRGSVSVICESCGEITHVDGLAEMHKNADQSTITMIQMDDCVFSSNVTRSECFSGITLFELACSTDRGFKNVRLQSGEILKLEPVHYKYIDRFAEHPHKYAVRGEYLLQGTSVTLF